MMFSRFRRFCPASRSAPISPGVQRCDRPSNIFAARPRESTIRRLSPGWRGKRVDVNGAVQAQVSVFADNLPVPITFSTALRVTVEESDVTVEEIEEALNRSEE